MIWKILRHAVPNPLTGMLLLAVPTYAWLALSGSLFYR